MRPSPAASSCARGSRRSAAGIRWCTMCAASGSCAASSCAAPTASRFPAAAGVSGLVSAEAKRRGLMIYSCPTPVGNEHMDALLLAPPLIISEQEIDDVAELLDGTLTAVESAL